MDNLKFTEDEIQRYARHITLPQVGGLGQRKLMNAKVLVIGAGGLGSPLLLYLAAAGVGNIGIIDDDKVELSNLQRQIIHKTNKIGSYKTDSAKETILSINPNINIMTYKERFSIFNAENIISQYDIVADGSDNFGTRFLANDTCFLTKKTLIKIKHQALEWEYFLNWSETTKTLRDLQIQTFQYLQWVNLRKILLKILMIKKIHIQKNHFLENFILIMEKY